jgi:hypothetical protein
MLGCLEEWWLGVFIAPTTKMAVGELCCRRAHRTFRCATRHCPVLHPHHRTVRVRSLELMTCGPPDSPVLHRTVRCCTGQVLFTVRCAICTCFDFCVRSPRTVALLADR